MKNLLVIIGLFTAFPACFGADTTPCQALIQDWHNLDKRDLLIQMGALDNCRTSAGQAILNSKPCGVSCKRETAIKAIKDRLDSTKKCAKHS